MLDSFDIWIGKYKATCKQVYESTLVNRFEISLQGKVVVLERQEQTSRVIKWKIKAFTPDVDVDKVIFLLDDIKGQIEAFINPQSSKHEYIQNKKSW